jgi:hypothetical protein
MKKENLFIVILTVLTYPSLSLAEGYTCRSQGPCCPVIVADLTKHGGRVTDFEYSGARGNLLYYTVGFQTRYYNLGRYNVEAEEVKGNGNSSSCRVVSKLWREYGDN